MTDTTSDDHRAQDSQRTAEQAARAAAPSDRQADEWAHSMREELGAIDDPGERATITALVAKPTPGVVFLDPSEMVTIATARARAAAGRPPTLEFDGLVNARVPKKHRAARLHEEYEAFWLEPPPSVQRCTHDQQAFLRGLHLRAITETAPWVYAPEILDPLGLDLPELAFCERVSGLVLDVVAQGTTETIELLARLLPVLPANTPLRVATASLIAQPIAHRTPRRRWGNDQRRCITIDLQPGCTSEDLAAMMRAVTLNREVDGIMDETELAPGVFLRASHAVRFPEGLDRHLAIGLHRRPTSQIHHGDRAARIALADQPELIPAFQALASTGGLFEQLEPRAALVLAGLDVAPLDRRDALSRAISMTAAEHRLTGFRGSFPHHPAAKDYTRLAALAAVVEAQPELPTTRADLRALTDAAISDGSAKRQLDRALERVSQLAEEAPFAEVVATRTTTATPTLGG